MLYALLALSLVVFDDRPEDERFESENQTGLKKSEKATSKPAAKPAAKATGSTSKALSAERVKEIAALKGKEAAVEGRVVEVFVPQGDGMAIFNIGKDRRNRFTVVIRSRNFEKFGGLVKLKGYKGKSIRVEGAVSIYRDLPQIEVSVPSQLSVK